MLLASLLLGWFRLHHDSWVPAPYAAVIAVLVFTVALLILGRAHTVQNRRAGDMLLWSGSRRWRWPRRPRLPDRLARRTR